MTKREKALIKIRQNPKNVRFEDIDNLLSRYGFSKRQKGSHAVYTHEDVPEIITVPFRVPFILPVYAKNVLKILDKYFETSGEHNGS